eukprot:1820981-Pyramimonas_sp.AAC.1
MIPVLPMRDHTNVVRRAQGKAGPDCQPRDADPRDVAGRGGGGRGRGSGTCTPGLRLRGPSA